MMISRPDTNRLYELLVHLHDDVRQLQYPYSAKVLKWGIIGDQEIEQALKANPGASEQSVWVGLKPVDVSGRIAGLLTDRVDSQGTRQKWGKAGLAEGSWRVFLDQYCLLKPVSEPFKSDHYFRASEIDNLLALTSILDEEIFGHKAMHGPTMLKVSLKSKWWKECHRIFSEAVEEEVYRQLSLDERPKHGACHTAEWDDKLKRSIREIASRWRSAPVWDQPQSTDPSVGVDFTSNNEATVKSFLTKHGFTTNHLEGRGKR